MQMILSTITLLAAIASAAPAPVWKVENVQEFSPNKRQTICQWGSSTRLKGDGSPKDWRLDIQLSSIHECLEQKVCGVTYSEVESVTIGADMGGGSSWISGGFSVSKSWETGNEYSCEGEKGDTLCVGQSVYHTEYEVQEGSINSCTSDFRPSKTYRITSPLKDGKGSKFWCEGKDWCGDIKQKKWVEV